MSAGQLNYTPLVNWLKGRGHNQYTQFGEDGLIAGCLEQIGETTRQCFEIGAADGRFFSNTLRLREQGWQAVLIEANKTQFSKLQEEFGEQSECIWETCSDLDATLSKTSLCTAPDLGVIDIDGQDWWMWSDLQRYRPRVLLIETAAGAATSPVPDRGAPGQAGLDAIRQLGEQKGYTLTATTYCNALFVESTQLV